MGPLETLTSDQVKALEAMRSGNNVFLTGDAGTGKSYVLDLFINEARKDSNVIACAPTGIAALKLPAGTTVHRAFKIKPAAVYSPSERDSVPGFIASADIVVLDEVSMCRCDLFDKICRIIRRAERKSRKKIQVIVAGDFLQLPPVMRPGDRKVLKEWYPEISDGWAFEGNEWNGLGLDVVSLGQVVRQEDAEYAEMLRLARRGMDDCLPFFNSRAEAAPGNAAIRLVSTNRKAEAINAAQLAKVRGKSVSYFAEATGVVNDGDKPAPDKLTIKRGARVMATVNDSDDAYQNGSIGTVLSADEDGVIVDFDGSVAEVRAFTWKITRPTITARADGTKKLSEECIGRFTQIPLKLAYAVTIHKSQGQTFDEVHVDPECFASGQLYVALSRCKSTEGLTLGARIAPGGLKASLSALSWMRLEGLEPEDGGSNSETERDDGVWVKVPKWALASVQELLNLLDGRDGEIALDSANG